MPSLARNRRLRQSPALPVQPPAPTSLSGRSTLEKLCFSSATPTESHPSIARRRSGCARSWRFAIACLALGKSFGPQKALLFVGFADRVNGILNGSACHPWRDPNGFSNPQSRHPCRAVRPSKSFAFCRLRRSGLTHPWRDPIGFSNPQSRRPGLRAQLGCARTAHEAALRKRLSSPLSSRSALKKLRFLSALPTGCLHSAGSCMPSLARNRRLRQPPALPVQPPSIARRRSGCARSWRFAIACLALGKSFGPQKALLFVGFADRVPAFCWIVHAIPGATPLVSPIPSLDILVEPFGPQKALLFVGFADRASPTEFAD